MNILIVVKNIKEGGVVRAAVNYKKCFESIRCNVKFYVIENANKEYIRFYNIKKKDLYNNLKEKWIVDIGFIISHGITLKNFISLDNIFKKKLFEINIFSTPSPYENHLEESFQLSKWMRFLYRLRGGIHDGHILPHAVNSDDFFYEPKNIIRKKYKISRKSKILLRVGQDSIGKWSLLMLKAFKALCLKDPNFFLVLLGAPDQIKKLIHNLDFDIKNRIIILNFNNDYGYLRNLYSEADLFWHIADQGESFGYVLAESLLCKTPVITLQTPWADNTQSEMIGESKGGIVCHCISDFIDQTINLANNPKEYKNKQLMGKNFVIKNYSIRSVSLLLKKLIFEKNQRINVNSSEDIFAILRQGIFGRCSAVLVNFYGLLLLINKHLFLIFAKFIKKIH